MKKDITEDLLIRYILGEASVSEAREIASWIAASEEHAKQFEQTKFILDTSRRLAQESPANELEAWERFKAKRDTVKKTAKIWPVAGYSRWLQLTAAVLILACGSWGGYYLFIRQPAQGVLVSIKTRDKVLTNTLPDGTIVHLNKNSSIAYHKNFKSNRTIRLTGEAFFNVIHDESAPFTVRVNEVTVRDIGTAFNVNSKSDRIEVIVESGLVKVSKNARTVQLKAQEMVSIQPNDKDLHIEKSNDLLYNYYRSHEFAARNTPLWRVVNILNEAYDAHIQIQGKELQNTPLTATFKEESLDKILQVLMLTTPGIHMQKTGQAIILKKN